MERLAGRLLCSLALAVALVAPVEASHCAGPTTTVPDATADLGPAGGPTYYVDDLCALIGHVTNHAMGCGDGGVWIYEESNGMAGLQRQDEVVDDTCHDMVLGDTIVF